LLADTETRYKTCEKSLEWFAKIYLSHYLSYGFDEFHYDIFKALEEEDLKRVSILGFRESAKSAIVNTLYVLWNICYNKRKFILSISEEGGLSATQTTSVATELLFNENIIKDFGKLYYDESEGQVKARKRHIGDFVCRNGVRLKAVSAGTKVRGLRHNEARPDLVILDDMDSLKSVVNENIRQAKVLWFKAEVLPGMSQSYGKCVVLGNMIHYDCFMASIRSEQDDWKHLTAPIYEGDYGTGKILWDDKYCWTEAEAEEVNKDREKNRKKIAIDYIKRDKGSRVFGQEYLLVPATDEDRIFKQKFIEQCLDFDRSFVTDREVASYAIVAQGNDLAISERESADYFVITTLGVEKSSNKTVIMNIYRDRGLSPEQQRQAVRTQKERYNSDLIFVEDNAYQAFFVKDLIETTSLPIKGFRTGANKRDEIIGLNALALQFENKNFILPYGNDETKRMVDILMEEMLQYPDGHSGDVLMSTWFAWNAIKSWDIAPPMNLDFDRDAFYNR